MRVVMLCVPAPGSEACSKTCSKAHSGKATPARLGAGVTVPRSYFFLRRAPFLAAFFAPPFLAAFLAPPFFAALRAPFLTALRVVFLAALRAPFFAAFLAPPFFAAFFAAFLAAFFTAFLADFFAAGFLAAFFFAGFLAAGLAAAGAGAAGAAAGSSVMLHGNVVSLLIGCSSGWIVDSGPLVALQERRRASPRIDSMRSSVIAARKYAGSRGKFIAVPKHHHGHPWVCFLRSSLIASSTCVSFNCSGFGHGRPERASCPDFSTKAAPNGLRYAHSELPVVTLFQGIEQIGRAHV